MCTDSIKDQLKSQGVRGTPRAAVPAKKPLENWEPVPQHEPSIAWEGYVRFRIPPRMELEFDGSVPARIRVPLGGGPALVISNEPDRPNMIGEVDLKNGDLVQGLLTLTRSTKHPRILESASLVIGGPTRRVRFELFRFQGCSGDTELQGLGWSKTLSNCVIQVTRIEAGAQPNQVAA